VKDVYPDAALLSYFEWYYHSQGADFGFLPDDPKDEEWPLRLRIKNMALNVDLIQCDGGLCPTQWQYQQIPSIFYPKLSVLHDGVDTDFMQPAETATVKLGNIELTKQHEVVTYVSRGLEPYRGFPQFMQAVAKLQKKRPHCQVLIVGEDRVAYGKKREDDKTYKQVLLEELDLDLSRIHFMGYVDYETLRSVFQISTVHIYLTIPFVLSWSILEAMACECIVLGSDTPPVREMISDGENGLLSDFFQIDELVKRTEAILENRERFKRLGVQARKQIIEKYAKSLLLPKHEALIKKVIQQP
jgi:glycosyltransferase involved in cell wall biosynthesis